MSLLDTASLIVTPNAYKEGKLYSVIPSDGSGDLSVTRATTATRVNSAGLVELVPYNLIRRSEEFNLIWSPVRSSIAANSTTAPNGTLTADTLIDDTNNNIHYIAQTFTAINGAATLSVYAKANQITQIQIAALGGTTPMGRGFNLSTGTVFTESVSGVSSNNLGQSITDVGNGWYRCEMSWTSTGQNEFWILLSVSNAATYMGTGTNGVYIWGAQVNEGSTALPYQKTETRLNIPRLDYSNGTCPSILVEPQRTNVLQRSQEFDNAYWQKLNGGVGSIPTVTANTATAPDGTLTADRIQLSLNGGTLFANLSYINANVSTTAATFSIYAKSNTTPCTIYFRNGSTVTTINITTEWQRFNLYSSGAITLVQFGLRGGSYGGAVNSNTADISVWGAQLEAGSYATSYIPTTSASVTRNADNIELLNSAILPTAYPFTIYSEAIFRANNAFSNAPFAYSFLNSSVSDNYYAVNMLNNKIQAYTRQTTEIITQSTNNFNIDTFYKIAVVWTASNIYLYVNGNLEGTSVNTIGFSGLDDLLIGQLRKVSDTGTRTSIKALAVFNQELTSVECQTLTTV